MIQATSLIPTEISSMPAKLSPGEPGSFAAFTLERRMPAILAGLQAHADTSTRQALHQLAAEIPQGSITPLPAAIFGELGQSIAPHCGLRWHEAPFLDVELYFYARILLAFGYTPAIAADPFAAVKFRATQQAIAWLAGTPCYSDPARSITAIIRWAVTSNSADLSQLTTADQNQISLLVDDSQAVADLLHAAPQRIDFVLDNAGLDVLADLLLIRALCRKGLRVAAHVRPYPMFVSDLTLSDLEHLLATLAGNPVSSIQQLGEESIAAIQSGQLTIHVSPALGLPICFCEDRARTAATFGDADLVIFKGDLNYRYFVGDRHWPHTTAKQRFAERFGRPAIALRSLKSEVLVGLSVETQAQTGQLEPAWLTNGHHGIIQVFSGNCL
ncbi:damage-control phosphatase ARMT1 family protein [Nitrosomonas sp. ANs5]|uniref:damage-control phosphatase ARMT1 family protein n=1 Tax=Nitrosomonas sp. ANs5 TaxID=3423941 RepID=UPI003D32FC82